MVMDARNRKSILAALQDASDKIAGQAKTTPEDVVSRVIADLWDQTDAPEEVVQYLLRKMANLALNASQSTRRANRRLRKLEPTRRPNAAETCKRDLDVEDLRMVRELGMQSCADEMDRDLLLVLMDDHPQFDTPHQVFHHHGASTSVGYRRLAILKEKLSHRYTALGLRN